MRTITSGDHNLIQVEYPLLQGDVQSVSWNEKVVEKDEDVKEYSEIVEKDEDVTG